ncbi:sulfatase-like hydrolase/transferase, partial [Pseudomonas aeruginosa]
LDARQAPAALQRQKKSLLVFVVGETARADHFSLNGYARETNPELSKQDIVNFTQVRSCGTSTAVSVPCMFS